MCNPNSGGGDTLFVHHGSVESKIVLMFLSLTFTATTMVFDVRLQTYLDTQNLHQVVKLTIEFYVGMLVLVSQTFSVHTCLIQLIDIIWAMRDAYEQDKRVQREGPEEEDETDEYDALDSDYDSEEGS